MISLDPRAGSGPLFNPLRSMSLPVRKKHLRFGDLSFSGRGPEGRILVGIEYKKLSDYLSCIVDKRLAAHQIPGMVRRYHPLGRWLIIEGVVRPRRDSMLEEFRTFKSTRGTDLGAFSMVRAPLTYSQMRRFEVTIRKRAGVEVVFTSCLADTLGTISALYHWYQKPWSAHHSHLALPAHQDAHPRVEFDGIFRRPSVLRRIASCLPNIGWTKSVPLAKTIRVTCGDDRIHMTIRHSDLLAIPGVGPKTVAKIIRVLREGK